MEQIPRVAAATPTYRSGAVHTSEPSSAWSIPDVRGMWEYAELLYFLAWRDTKVRYKQALFGVGWAVVQPLLMMAIFTVFLGHYAKVPSNGVPYAVFAFAGLLPWTYFASSITKASESLASNPNLITKVYFPRLVMPLAALLTYLVDLGVASLALFGLMPALQVSPSWHIVALPLFVIMLVLTAAAVAVWVAPLNVAYRDVRAVLPFVVQVWLFATPVVYPASLIPHQVRWAYGVNPMSGVVEGFRWSLIGESPSPWALAGVSAAITVVLLLAGLVYFRRVEDRLADVI